MKRILVLFGFLIAFIVMANVEHKSHQEEIRKAVLNLNQDVYEYILLQIDKPHVTDEDVWNYYQAHRKSLEEIELSNM